MQRLFSAGEDPINLGKKCIILSLYECNGEALEHGYNHVLKLTDKVMKLLEWVLDLSVCTVVNIKKMQFGSVSCRSTTDAIFIVCRLQKFIDAHKPLCFAFVDLEKAFDHVPGKIRWWAFISLGVNEWTVQVIKGSYARIRVPVNGQYSAALSVGVGVHQGFVLSPLIFIPVLEVLLRKFCTSVLCDLFYTDDLVLIANSQEECSFKLKAWKSGVKSKTTSFVSLVVTLMFSRNPSNTPVPSAAVMLATTSVQAVVP